MPLPLKISGPATVTREHNQFVKMRSLQELSQIAIARDEDLLKKAQGTFAQCRIKTLVDNNPINYQVSLGSKIPFTQNHSNGLVFHANTLADGSDCDRLIPIKIFGCVDKKILLEPLLEKYPNHLWYFRAKHINNHHSNVSGNIIIHAPNFYDEQLEVKVRLIPVKKYEKIAGVPNHEIIEVTKQPSSIFNAPTKSLLFHLITPETPATPECVAQRYKYTLNPPCIKKIRSVLTLTSSIPYDQALAVRIHGDIMNLQELNPRHCLATRIAPTMQIMDPATIKDKTSFLEATSTTLIYKNALLEVEILGCKALTWKFH